MRTIWRSLTLTLGFLVLLALCVAALALAVFALQGGDDPLSYQQLADTIALEDAQAETGMRVDELEQSDPVQGWWAAAGVAGVLLGVAILAGAVLRPRRRRMPLGGDERAEATRGGVAQFASDVAADVDGVTAARARIRGRRRLQVVAMRSRLADEDSVRSSIMRRLDGIASTTELQPSLSVRAARPGERVV